MSQELIQKLTDPFYLPTLAELKTAFPLEDSFATNSEEIPWVTPEFTKHQMLVKNYQVYTQEFIQSLAAYLQTRNLKIIEVGAGDGRLTYFLKQATKNHPLDITATDIKDWEEQDKTNASLDVEKLGYMEAIKKYASQPTLILSCWMNLDVNWTADFRSQPTVKEYILIGDIFRTAGYGRGWYLPENSGFTCHKLTRTADGTKDGIIKSCIGRFDGSPHNFESRTETYSFVRE